jgi:hypothetical protein
MQNLSSDRQMETEEVGKHFMILNPNLRVWCRQVQRPEMTKDF